MISSDIPRVNFAAGATSVQFGDVTFDALRPIDEAFYWPEKKCFVLLTQDEKGKPNAVEIHDMTGSFVAILESTEGLRPYYFTMLASGEPGVVCTVDMPINEWSDWNCCIDLTALELRRLSPSK